MLGPIDLIICEVREGVERWQSGDYCRWGFSTGVRDVYFPKVSQPHGGPTRTHVCVIVRRQVLSGVCQRSVMAVGRRVTGGYRIEGSMERVVDNDHGPAALGTSPSCRDEERLFPQAELRETRPDSARRWHASGSDGGARRGAIQRNSGSDESQVANCQQESSQDTPSDGQRHQTFLLG